MASEELWANLFHQLNKAAYCHDWFEIERTACAGQLSRSAFIDKCMRLEYKQAMLTAQFYERSWFGKMRRCGLGSFPLPWCSSAAGSKKQSYEKWIRLTRARVDVQNKFHFRYGTLDIYWEDPERLFGEYWDNKIAKRRK